MFNSLQKTCSACKEMKDHSQFSRGNGQDGLQYRCKSCHAEWAVQNKEKCQERKRAWYEKNKEKVISASAEWRRKNQDEAKKQAADRYLANQDEVKARTRLWVSLNPDRKAASDKSYAKSNPEAVRKNKKRWADANPEHKRMARSKRRARERNAPGAHTVDDIKDIRSLQKNKCACCKVSLTAGYHVDHKKALANGGSNDRSNLQLLCPRCNLSKGAKDELEFMVSMGFLL